jgi:hypothetical protein
MRDVDGILLKGKPDYLGGQDSGPGAGGAGGAFGATGYGAGGAGDANAGGAGAGNGNQGYGKDGVYDPAYIANGGNGAYGHNDHNSGTGKVRVGANGEILYGAGGDYTGS